MQCQDSDKESVHRKKQKEKEMRSSRSKLSALEKITVLGL